MTVVSRREFCASLFAAAIAGRVSALPAKESFSVPDVAAIDEHRILTAANGYLKEQPITITAYSSPRSAGGTHDYFSEGDYWWPDPKNPGGPYIQRDGMSNPDNFNQHRHALIRLSLQVPALAGAWMVTNERRYAEHAAKHLRAWFLDPKTLMNPNLQYAQAIHGITAGRGIGIIDTLHLVEVARAVPAIAVARGLSTEETQVVKHWFDQYLAWMRTSTNGMQERDAKNNHGTCWAVQAAQFATLTGNEEVKDSCRSRFREVQLPHQVAQNGSFPEELRRTKPYGYCLFNLDAMATLCQILSTPDDNLFAYELPDGRSFSKAMAFMFPFIADKDRWPYKHDVQYWNAWPARQPSLLFAGVALKQEKYLQLWKRLEPDPTVEEIIRNFPIRQPILWLPHQNL